MTSDVLDQTGARRSRSTTARSTTSLVRLSSAVKGIDSAFEPNGDWNVWVDPRRMPTTENALVGSPPTGADVGIDGIGPDVGAGAVGASVGTPAEGVNDGAGSTTPVEITSNLSTVEEPRVAV
jgi:hypothetical protein